MKSFTTFTTGQILSGFTNHGWMVWVEHITCTAKKRNAYNVRNSKVRPSYRWQNSIEMGLKNYNRGIVNTEIKISVP
jgi:hypothetical protein